MPNLYDYLSWRGDLSLSQAPLNEVDYLILSWLTYVSWDHILPPPDDPAFLSLQQAADLYFSAHPDPIRPEDAHSINVAVSGAALLKKAAFLPRYRDLRLGAFANELDLQEEKQFAALTYLFGETAVVAFRGTDTTIVGWKEDCFLALSEAVPAQLSALNYVLSPEINDITAS